MELSKTAKKRLRRKMNKKNREMDVPQKDTENTKVILNSKLRRKIKRSQIFGNQNIWCLHTDCLISTDCFNNANELQNHMDNFH